MSSRLRVTAVPLSQANAFVAVQHRHHQPVTGHKFSLGVVSLDDGQLRGVAIVGRPVARRRDDGMTLEVTRVATDGHDNACSALYGACWRAAKALGYERLGTYTLISEPGTSLKAAGWTVVHRVRGRSWNVQSRPRRDRHPLEDKLLWEPQGCSGSVSSPTVDDEVERLQRELTAAARTAVNATQERDRLLGELYQRGLGLR